MKTIIAHRSYGIRVRDVYEFDVDRTDALVQIDDDYTAGYAPPNYPAPAKFSTYSIWYSDEDSFWSERLYEVLDSLK